MVYVGGIVSNMAAGQFPPEADGGVVAHARLRSNVCTPFTNIVMANVNRCLRIFGVYLFQSAFKISVKYYY